jgi:type I restriction enzyme M protein
MGATKEVERAARHRTIWRIANDLRGSVGGWDFKSYVLGMLFYRFISENLTAYLNEQERQAGTPDFEYAILTDADAEQARADVVAEKHLGRSANLSHPRLAGEVARSLVEV